MQEGDGCDALCAYRRPARQEVCTSIMGEPVTCVTRHHHRQDRNIVSVFVPLIAEVQATYETDALAFG